MKKIIYSILLLLFPMLLTAQVCSDSLYSIENRSVIIDNENLLVSFNIVIPQSTHLSSNEVLEINPTLFATSSQTLTLPCVYIAGRSRNIINQRDNVYNNNTYRAIKRKNKTMQSVEYTIRLPFESWMNNGRIELVSYLHGCANCQKSEDQIFLAGINRQDYVVSPHIALIEPPKEEVKMRKLTGSAYLDFPVNKTVIYPDFMNNERELLKIRNSIEVVQNDTNTYITDIKIVGYASPEGSYAGNARLAEGRAQALKDYIIQQYKLRENVIEVSSIPEDWVGLKTYITNSQINYKQEILDIINSDLSEDAKDNKIKTIGDGSTYQFLLKNVYPFLRHSDYTINYRVNEFNVEEAKVILKRSPHQLSLQELYRIAETYAKGSDEFNEVFDIAVRLFPNDETANANAGAIEIINGNLNKATLYLAKANGNNAAVINNLGVIELLSDNLDAAEALFMNAKAKGSGEAANNLIELNNKRSDLSID